MANPVEQPAVPKNTPIKDLPLGYIIGYLKADKDFRKTRKTKLVLEMEKELERRRKQDQS